MKLFQFKYLFVFMIMVSMMHHTNFFASSLNADKVTRFATPEERKLGIVSVTTDHRNNMVFQYCHDRTIVTYKDGRKTVLYNKKKRIKKN